MDTPAICAKVCVRLLLLLACPWVLVQLQVVVRLRMQGGLDIMEPPAADDEGCRGRRRRGVSGLYFQSLQVRSLRVCVWGYGVCVCVKFPKCVSEE